MLPRTLGATFTTADHFPVIQQWGLGYDWVKIGLGSTKDVVSRTCTWVNHVVQWTSVMIILPKTTCSKVYCIKAFFIFYYFFFILWLVNNLQVFLKVRSLLYAWLTKKGWQDYSYKAGMCFCSIGVTKDTCNICSQVSQTLPAIGHTNRFLLQTHTTVWLNLFAILKQKQDFNSATQPKARSHQLWYL